MKYCSPFRKNKQNRFPSSGEGSIGACIKLINVNSAIFKLEHRNWLVRNLLRSLDMKIIFLAKIKCAMN